MTRPLPQLWLVAALVLGLPSGGVAANRPAPSHGITSLQGVEGIERVDRALLPRLDGPVAVHVHALEAVIVLEAPRAGARLAQALRLAPIALCPDVDETATGALLRCRSRRIVGHLTRSEAGWALDVAETRGLPWDGDDGPPMVAIDPIEAGLGAGCPGSTPAGRAECLLARGDAAAAGALLATVRGTAAEESVALRLGDLAFAQGDVLTATAFWSRTRGRPWEKLAAARLCELSWTCISTSRLEDVYAAPDVPEWAQRDLRLRYARTLTFLGRPGHAAEVLVNATALAACASARSLCRDIAGAALADPGPRSLDALAVWIGIPDLARGAASYQAITAAAAVAEREGAPIFAANLLASAAGEVPTRLLREHLLRTAELYVTGGDLVRAGVIVEFARTRAGDKALNGPRWAAVTRAVRSTPPVKEGRTP